MENSMTEDKNEVAPENTNKNPEVSTHEQVRREFEAASDHGEPELEQLKNELGEPNYMLPSPMNSREDATFTNINPDQLGEAFGLNNQANEPLDMVEKIDARDENRWELNPESDRKTKS